MINFRVFADDNFKLDENGIRFSKWVENTVGKGEIARKEQFLLFPTVFSANSFSLEESEISDFF